MTKTLAEEIITIIEAHSNNNPAPTTGTITRTYTDGNYADVETEDGTHRYVPVIGNNAIDTDGVIIYIDGDLNNPLLITSGGGSSGGTVILGTGAFSINTNGHLIVELPDGVDNPYYINSNGHLIYDTHNPHNNGE